MFKASICNYSSIFYLAGLWQKVLAPLRAPKLDFRNCLVYMYEPLTIGILFPFIPHRPWQLQSTPKMLYMARKVVLPAWETSLLSCLTEEKLSITTHNLKQHLEQATNLYLVSDGGATEGHGYFGWVIATGSTVLWNGKGRVQGNTNLMESLRTESVGLLSLTRFVYHYSKYYNLNLNQATTYHYCDNPTVVRCMQWYTDRRDIIETPNHILSPDNDVQVQIEATLRELSSNFSSTWVRGHQDNIPREELPWEAILNIEADHLATEARDETSANDTTFEQFPASKMMLYINNLPITRSTMNEVRYAWSTQ
eukprot:scaffold29619_cov63-Attheya_sp.AAC.6